MKVVKPSERTVLNEFPEKMDVYCHTSENWCHLKAKELRALHQKQGSHPVYELRPDKVVIVEQKV